MDKNNTKDTKDTKYTKYKDKGLSGLMNLGNTCFINSCIQILSHTYELNDILNNDIYKQRLNKKPDTILLIEWDNLRKLLWNNNCVVSPGKFIQCIQKISKIKNMPIFSGFQQNDIGEFLLFIIDCFHNSLSREIKMTISGVPDNQTDQLALKCFKMMENIYSKDYSEIWNLFYAVNVSQIIRVDNQKSLGINPEPYFTINLSIPSNHKSPSLIDCFDSYVEGETVSGFLDEETNEKVDIVKRIQFWSFPTILVIDLKRFNQQLHKIQKNQILVTFPLDDLDLSKYVIGYKKDSYKYELFGVCNHSGNVLGGHYTAYVKNANNKWYHYNDTIVQEISSDKIVTPKAYVLFYRKK